MQKMARLIVLLPFFFIIVDIVSGYILHEYGVNIGISIVYKFLYLIICFFLVLSKDDNFKRYLLFFLVLCLLYLVIYLFIYGELYLIYQAIELFKIFSVFIIIMAFDRVSRGNKYGIFEVGYYKFTTFLLYINVSVGLLGAGYSLYGEYGYKGYFYSGNSLSGIVVVIASYWLAKYKKERIKFLLAFVFLISLATLISTKSAFLGITIMATYWVVYFFPIKHKLFIVFLALLFSSVVIENFMESAMYERLSFMYESGGLINLLLSGRNEFLVPLLNAFNSESIYSTLLGLDRSIAGEFTYSISEMDIIDLVVFFGFPLSILYVLFLLIFYFYLKKILDKDSFSEARLFTAVLIMIGSISGHVLMNGVVTPYWGVAIGYIILRNRNENCDSFNTIPVR